MCGGGVQRWEGRGKGRVEERESRTRARARARSLSHECIPQAHLADHTDVFLLASRAPVYGLGLRVEG